MRLLLTFLLAPVLFAAERINHEGRILGDLPVVTTPLFFNTPEADAVVSAMQIMPPDSAWNEDISGQPLLANSDAMIAMIKADLPSDRQNLRLFREMNFALVPDNQPVLPVRFLVYPGESDLDGGTTPNGNYPVPTNLPIESWPYETGSQTLEQWQQSSAAGDRHAIIVKPGANFIWETWQMRRVGTAWQASNGAKFSLANNNLRPAGWTSADAAGLAMFPAIVRYDECQRGMVEHALRLIVKRTRVGPIYPATHQASVGNTTDPAIPAMGQRLRLKASFVIPGNWTIQEKAVLLALKKYGAIVADNGGFFSMSISPDNRFPAGCFNHISSIDINQFEAVQTTGATGGPRSAGAPTAQAGSDQWVPLGSTANLTGAVTSSSAVAVNWKLYSGPAAVTIANATQATATTTFAVPGVYTFMLSVDDDIHAVAYDAVVIRVIMTPTITPSGNDQWISFPSATGHHYQVEHSSNLTDWTPLGSQLTGTGAAISVQHVGALTLPEGRQFYRVVVVD